MDLRTTRTTVTTATVLLLMVLTAGCAVTSARSPIEDETIAGPEWNTGTRRGVGAATATAPARLTDVVAEDHERYDRVVFTFDGERPGYRVAYSTSAGRGADPRLRITLDRVVSVGERHLTPQLTTVRDVRQGSDAGHVVETIVTVTASGTGPLPFRVGLAVGEFYVDIAHPNEQA